MLALYGLIFTILDYSFIWFSLYLDFVTQNTIKKTVSTPVIAYIVTELKAMKTGVQLETTMLIP